MHIPAAALRSFAAQLGALADTVAGMNGPTSARGRVLLPERDVARFHIPGAKKPPSPRSENERAAAFAPRKRMQLARSWARWWDEPARAAVSRAYGKRERRAATDRASSEHKQKRLRR
jgi:hypothetical protein